MYIHPRYQRRGYGTQALRWGLDQATRERVPVLAKSTSQGYRLYHQAGFQSIKKLDFGGLFDPGEPGMHLMVWEPE
jgi:GNAT superfamily N-acetyltransferase